LIVADIAHVLHTPINVLEDMEFEELLLYHEEARRIVEQTNGE